MGRSTIPLIDRPVYRSSMLTFFKVIIYIDMTEFNFRKKVVWVMKKGDTLPLRRCIALEKIED